MEPRRFRLKSQTKQNSSTLVLEMAVAASAFVVRSRITRIGIVWGLPLSLMYAYSYWIDVDVRRQVLVHSDCTKSCTERDLMLESLQRLVVWDFLDLF